MAENLTAVLERKPVETADIEELLRAPEDQLAADAQKLLGYTVPLKTSEVRRQSAQLAQVLSKEGIRPFTKESVERYQRAAIRARTPRLLRPSFVDPLLTVLAFGGTVATIGGFVAAMATHRASLFLIVAGGILSIVLAVVAASGTTNLRWVTREIKDYPRSIPTPVLHRAVLLKRALPGATVNVMELTRAQRLTLDPFLVVSYGDRTEYVDVWDERGFVPDRAPVSAAE